MEILFSAIRNCLHTHKILRGFCAVLIALSANAWSAPEAAPKTPASANKPAAAPKSGVININTADATKLTELDGVGDAKAAAIVEYRKEHGPFKSVDQLAEVKGIGEKFIEKNRDRISVR